MNKRTKLYKTVFNWQGEIHEFYKRAISKDEACALVAYEYAIRIGWLTRSVFVVLERFREDNRCTITEVVILEEDK